MRRKTMNLDSYHTKLAGMEQDAVIEEERQVRARTETAMAYHEDLDSIDLSNVTYVEVFKCECIKVKLKEEIDWLWKMLEAIDKRLQYLEKFTFANITKIAQDLPRDSD